MFFVSVVFCNSEVAKHPDMLLPVSMTTVSKKTNSSYNSMIIIYHKKMREDGYLNHCYTQTISDMSH